MFIFFSFQLIYSQDLSPSGCEIKADYHKDACFIDLAKQEGDASYCEYITETSPKEGCYYQLYHLTLDTSLCKNFYHDSAQEKCLSYIATNQSNIDLCREITDGFWKNSCKRNIAVKTKNISLCKEINTSYEQRACLLLIAEDIKDSLICNNHYDPSERDICLTHYAQDLKDKSACGAISSSVQRQECIDYLVYDKDTKQKVNNYIGNIGDIILYIILTFMSLITIFQFFKTKLPERLNGFIDYFIVANPFFVQLVFWLLISISVVISGIKYHEEFHLISIGICLTVIVIWLVLVKLFFKYSSLNIFDRIIFFILTSISFLSYLMILQDGSGGVGAALVLGLAYILMGFLFLIWLIIKVLAYLKQKYKKVGLIRTNAN